MTYVKENLARVQAQVAEAEREAGRAGQTRMVAAVKYASNDELAALLSLGVAEVGENRVQQLLEHLPVLERGGAKIHFIGSLQTNKVKYIVDKVALIHSVDSLRLAAEIERQAAKRGVCVGVLVEINGAREQAKTGVMPEEAEALCRAILEMPHLDLQGFMTMGPRFDSQAEYQAYFAGVRAQGQEIFARLLPEKTPIFSMGMSESYPAAIAAGADIVRVGRTLFSPSAQQSSQ